MVIEYVENDSDPQRESFDEIVFACDADTALKILGKCATWRERNVLGSVKYLNDVTITHNDLGYMNKVSVYCLFLQCRIDRTTTSVLRNQVFTRIGCRVPIKNRRGCPCIRREQVPTLVLYDAISGRQEQDRDELWSVTLINLGRHHSKFYP